MLLSFGSSARTNGDRQLGGVSGNFQFAQKQPVAAPGETEEHARSARQHRRRAGAPPAGARPPPPVPPASCFSSSSRTTGDVKWMVSASGGSFVFLITMAASPTDWIISYLSSVMACNAVSPLSDRRGRARALRDALSPPDPRSPNKADEEEFI